MKLLYPTSYPLDVKLLEGFSVSLHPYDVKKPIPDDLVDAEIMVTWGNTPENLHDAVKRMTKLRWIQSLAAGPNDVLNAGFDISRLIVTSGSSLHDEPVAEHTMGLLLNAARRFYEMRDYQNQGKWPGHLGGSQFDLAPNTFRTLKDANITIWGFGNIGKRLAPLLRALGANVQGIARTAGVRDGVHVYGEDSLPTLLPKTDALVMILPSSKATNGSLSAERLAMLPSHAWVVNVGRGPTIDEEAVADALYQGRIGGAALDVFVDEPLKENSRLWKAPNFILSPHAAGGRPRGSEALIAENLRRFIAGQTLSNVM
jgi:phosphoglycerate dehydrogenase-like enzyme